MTHPPEAVDILARALNEAFDYGLQSYERPSDAEICALLDRIAPLLVADERARILAIISSYGDAVFDDGMPGYIDISDHDVRDMFDAIRAGKDE